MLYHLYIRLVFYRWLSLYGKVFFLLGNKKSKLNTMKIGIITYWQSNDNYGQLLQCYALQRYLVQIGHEPFLIRYDISNRYSANNKWKKVLKILMVYPVLKYLLNKKKKSS